MNASINTTLSVAESSSERPGHESVAISAGGCEIVGQLATPVGARGLVISMMTSGRSLDDATSEALRQHLESYGLATLWFSAPAAARFDSLETAYDFELLMLAHQLLQATRWAKRDPRTRQLGMGYLAAGINAAAALVVAGQLGYAIQSVVAYDSLPEAAGNALGLVTAPTLLIVREGDESGLRCNERAYERMVARRELVVVAHGKYEPEQQQSLERLATLATNWFLDHLEPIKKF